MEDYPIHPVITYRSHYGHSKSYAEWLSEELGGALFDLDATPYPNISQASAVVLVCPIYARGLLGAKEFAKLVDKSPQIPLIGVTVCASDPENPKNVNAYRSVIDSAFPESIRSRMTWFHVRGGLDYPRMSRRHRAMMWIVTRLAKRQAAKGDHESQMMYESYGKVIDFRDPSAIKPIVEHVRGVIGGD
ncbi:flavodoxin domain-containing protein [Corynebacterium lubricantis]|uniref:flavodoxin domain-containing protein n=1 Tax=Corynebacterium lubricantis TaxID=541095 RepID=UPI0003632095|nr:flavodoxin domain-containing protein [Corynebacterium lubricantis]